MNNLQQNTNQLSAGQSPQDPTIHFILKAMEARIEQIRGNIDVSRKMLPLGVETDLTQTIKKVVQDPLSQLIPIKEDLDSTISGLITIAVRKFFDIHKEKVSKVYKTDIGSNRELHFSIVLNRNTSNNRGIIMSFLREYKSTSIWESFPVYFQFVPQIIAHKISSKEIILE